MQFNTIPGHHEIHQRLFESYVNNRIAHAYMLSGPEGNGALSLALSLASLVLCEKPEGNDSCGNCAGCVKSIKLIHPDMHFIVPSNATVEKSKDGSEGVVEEWKKMVLEHPFASFTEWTERLDLQNRQAAILDSQASAIIQKLSLKAYEGEFKVMLIWLPEKMNIKASNKILKILEEPPEKTLFILVTESLEGLLPTIISRTQIVHVPLMQEKELCDFLGTEHNAEAKQALEVCKIGGRNLNTMIKLLTLGDEAYAYRSLFVNWMRLCYTIQSRNKAGQEGVISLNKWVESTSRLHREQIKSFLIYGLRIIRECAIMNFGSENLMTGTEAELTFLNKFHPFVNQDNLIEFNEHFNEAVFHLERNVNQKIMLFDLSLKVVKLLQVGRKAVEKR